MPKSPSKEIKQIRRELNLSQERFGEKVGISGKSISAYETGRVTPPLKVMEKIARTYNFDFDGPKLMTRETAIETVKLIREQLKNIEASL